MRLIKIISKRKAHNLLSDRTLHSSPPPPSTHWLCKKGDFRVIQIPNTHIQNTSTTLIISLYDDFNGTPAKHGQDEVIMRSSHEIAGQVIMCLNVELELALVLKKVLQPTTTQVRVLRNYGTSIKLSQRSYYFSSYFTRKYCV